MREIVPMTSVRGEERVDPDSQMRVQRRRRPFLADAGVHRSGE